MWRDYLAIALSIFSLGVGISTPIFLIPGCLISCGCAAWVFRRSPKLKKRRDQIIAKHQQKLRESLESEFEVRSNELITKLGQKELSLQEVINGLVAREEYLNNWQVNLLEMEKRLSDTIQKQHEYYQEREKEIAQAYEAEIQLRENSILDLQQRIMGLTNRPDPKQGFAAWIASMLLQALSQNEVFCELKGFYKPPGIREVSVWIRLSPTTPAKKLENCAKEVGTLVNFGEPTILWDADECVYEFQFAPQVDSYETSYEVVIDNESELPDIEEPTSKSWFVDVVLDSKSVHYMIHGPSGGGKSVLVDNLVCVAGDDLATATGKKLRIFICDPKFPDSEWTYRGERLKPQYRRWEGAVQGVLDMQQEVNSRLDEAASAAEAVPDHLYRDINYDLPIPERDIDFWVVDEAAALYLNYPKQCELAYKSTLWVGRSTLVKAILVGQNPNSSNYGLQIPDLSNCVRFYVGITALEALDRYIKPPRDIKAKLKGQIYARLKKVKEQKLAGIKEPPEQFFALVVKSNEPPFVAQLPPPKAYAYSESKIQAVLGEVAEESLEVLVEREKLKNLPQDYKEVVEYARIQETWITASKLRQNRNRFKTVPSQKIKEIFKELHELGVGQISEDYKYRYPKQES